MKKLSVKEDWPFIMFLLFYIIGLIVAILDIILIQRRFQFSIYFFIGIAMFTFGTIIENLIRVALIKAGFKDMMSSVRLQTVENHELVTEGLFKYIRHPMYFGMIFQTLGFAFIGTSFIALIVMVVTCLFLLPRILIEEKMLLEEFGEQYEEYKKKTKQRLIPFIY